MSKACRMTVWGVCAMLAAVSAWAETDFVFNARPAAILIDMSGDKFTAQKGQFDRTSSSTVYTMPNFDMGIGVPWKELYGEATVGAGVLLNDTFRSFLLQAGVAGEYEATESLSLGPRLALVHVLDPEWTENEDVDFDDGTGWLLGLQVMMGDKIRYIVSVDYLDIEMDANTVPGVTADDKLDISGLAIQFGVRGEF